jgi:hypothetical protein
MRAFLLRSLSFFIGAIALTIALFFFVNSQLRSGDLPTKDTVSDVVQEVATVTKEKSDVAKAEAINKVPEDGILLSSIPLTESQKKALSSAGIDTETFKLTPEMIACGAEKLGSERVNAIISGSTPSLLEVTKLTPCLTR